MGSGAPASAASFEAWSASMRASLLSLRLFSEKELSAGYYVQRFTFAMDALTEEAIEARLDFVGRAVHAIDRFGGAPSWWVDLLGLAGVTAGIAPKGDDKALGAQQAAPKSEPTQATVQIADRSKEGSANEADLVMGELFLAAASNPVASAITEQKPTDKVATKVLMPPPPPLSRSTRKSATSFVPTRPDGRPERHARAPSWRQNMANDFLPLDVLSHLTKGRRPGPNKRRREQALDDDSSDED